MSTVVKENTFLDGINLEPDDDNYCHIKFDNNRAYCGYTKRKHLGHSWKVYHKECSCGTIACPTCVVLRERHTEHKIEPF